MSNDVWWDNVKFRDFCAHFINMTPEEIAADIKESLVKLIQLDDSGDSFGAMMVKNAKLRQGSPRSEASRQNGIKGGRPRKDKESTAGATTSDVKPEASRQVRQGTKPFGKFGNVYITDDEYAELGLAVGNQNELNAIIDALGASLEDGSRTSTNHYATLTKWVQYRKDKDKEKEERQNANSETFAEREGRRQRKILERFGMV